MGSRSVVAWVVAAGVSAAVPATAEVITFARIAGWEAYGGVASDGQQVCGVSSGGGGRWFGLKYYRGDTGLTVQMSKTTWQMANGIQTKVTMQFDDESPWRATAKGYVSNGSGFLEFDVPRQSLDLFLKEFKNGDKMRVRFPNESAIDDWVVDLAGTTAIAEKLFDCIRAMAD